MAWATSAAPVMNPKAATKSANLYSRWSLPPWIFQSGSFDSAAAISVSLNFVGRGVDIGSPLAMGCSLIRTRKSVTGANSRHAPYDVAHVVRDQQRAVLADHNADRPPEGLALVAEETGQHVDGLARGLAADERHEDDLVAAARLTVPRAVLSHEHPVRKLGGEPAAVGEGQAERSGVRAQRVVGRNRLGHQVRSGGLHPLVDVLPVIAVRPAVEAAVAHRGQIVRHEIAAELVAFVGHGPERAAAGLPAEAVRVPQARGEDAVAAGLGVHLPDRRATLLDLHPVLGGVAVGANGHVEFGPVRAGDDVLRPVVVDSAGRQI